MAEEPMAETQRAPKRRHGCFFWGCLTTFILLILILAGGGFLMYYLVTNYTSTTPVPVPKYVLKAGEKESLEKRFAAFEEAPKAPGASTLELTASDLNALIAASPEGDRLSGKVFARIEGDKAFVDFCVPLDGVPALEGRYVNGTAQLSASVVDGRLQVSTEKLTVKDRDLPAGIVSALKDTTFVKDLLAKKVSTSETGLKKIEVKDGKLILER